MNLTDKYAWSYCSISAERKTRQIKLVKKKKTKNNDYKNLQQHNGSNWRQLKTLRLFHAHKAEVVWIAKSLLTILKKAKANTFFNLRN